jgi:SAM-dependent methyltransferase
MPTTPSVLASVRSFSDQCLPSRRWKRVLVVGSDAGDAAVLLAERGYDVALRGADDAEQRLALAGLEVAADDGGELDAIVVADGAPDVVDAVRHVRGRLRPGGLVLASALSARRRELRRLGFKMTDELGAPALRRRGRVGRVVRAVV